MAWVDVKDYEKAQPDIIAVRGAENILKVLFTLFQLHTSFYLTELLVCSKLTFSACQIRCHFRTDGKQAAGE